MKQRRILFYVGLATAIAVASPALAMDEATKEAVRTLTNDGAADLEAGHYEAARDKLGRAYGTAPVPTIGLLLARAHVKLGQLVRAQEVYRQVTVLERTELWVGRTQQQAQAEAQTELEELKVRVPLLTVTVEGADASQVGLVIDGTVVPRTIFGVARSVDPGEHAVVGKFGKQVVEQTVLLVEGERKAVVVKFTAEPGAGAPAPVAASGSSRTRKANAAIVSGSEPKASSAQRTWGWVSLGVGAAGVAVGTVAGVIVLSKASELTDKCEDDHDCPSSYSSDVDSYNMKRTLSTAGFIVGGLGTALGVTLLLTSPKEQPERSVALYVGPEAAGLKGSF